MPANVDDLFEGVPPPAPYEGLTPKPGGTFSAPMTGMQKFYLNNIFDTQPKRREAYMKQLGYELNPKDDNQYRPIGSAGGYAEVDTKIHDILQPGGLKKMFKGADENYVVQQLKNNVGTVGSTAASTAGSVAGGALGLLGGPMGAAAGAVLGGAVGNHVAEETKNALGNLLLKEDVPMDRRDTLFQDALVGIMPQFMKAGAKSFVSGYSGYLTSVEHSIENAIKQSGPGFTSEIIAKAVKNPEMFTKEATEGAAQKLSQVRRQIFGLDDDLQAKAPNDIKGGMFGDKMNALNAKADEATARLANQPAARVGIDELTTNQKDFMPPDPKTGKLPEPSSIDGKIQQLGDIFGPSKDEKAALEYLRAQKSELENLYKNKAGPDGKVDFQTAREWLSRRQSEIMDKDAAGNYKNDFGPELARTFGGGEGEGIRNMLDAKAGQLGSDLPEINAQRSKVFQAYNAGKQTYTTSNLTNAFLSNDPNTPARADVMLASKAIDDVLGSSITQKIQDGSMQRVFNQLYENPKGFRTGNVVQDTLMGAAKGGAAGAVAGGAAEASMTGGHNVTLGATLGAIPGAIKGGMEGYAMTSPESGLAKLSDTIDKNAAINSYLGPQVPENGLLSTAFNRIIQGSPAITEPAAVSIGQKAGQAIDNKFPDSSPDLSPSPEPSPSPTTRLEEGQQPPLAPGPGIVQENNPGVKVTKPAVNIDDLF